MNKLIDVGWNWPFPFISKIWRQSPGKLALCKQSLRTAEVAAIHQNAFLSTIGGMVTLVGSWLYKYLVSPALEAVFCRLDGKPSSPGFLNGRINFVGSTFILLLCLDWNVLARRATVFCQMVTGLKQRS